MDCPPKKLKEDLAKHLVKRHKDLFKIQASQCRESNQKAREERIRNLANNAATIILEKIQKPVSPNDVNDVMRNDDEEYVEMHRVSLNCGEFPDGQECGEFPQGITVNTKMEMLVNYDVAKSYEYGPSQWGSRYHMLPSIIETTFKNLTDRQKMVYAFYARVLVQSVSKSFMQTALDSHYTHLYKKDPSITIKSKKMRNRVRQDFNFTIDMPPLGQEVPESSRALVQGARKIVLKLFGPFLNIYRAKINVQGSKVNNFFFVDPIPLALLNLHHPEMLSIVRDFKVNNPGETPFLISPGLSYRSKFRVGNTVDGIYEEHARRAMNDIKYIGSVPLLIRIFLDGALVSNWTNLSLTPILLGIENLHPNIQATIAAKILVGYYPEISINDGMKKNGGTIHQQCWHVIMGKVFDVFENYHKKGGISIVIPGEYNADGEASTVKFFPYICAFGELVYRYN